MTVIRQPSFFVIGLFHDAVTQEIEITEGREGSTVHGDVGCYFRFPVLGGVRWAPKYFSLR